MKKIKIILALSLFIILFSCSNDNSVTEPILKVPVTTTNQVTDISIYSLKISGKLMDAGDAPVTELGFVVGYSSMPTIENNLAKTISQADTEGNFYIIYQSLPSNTVLYIRAYAINSIGVGYGNEVICTTLTENVFTGTVHLYTQEQVNNFGANHYTSVDGEIDISGNTINSLASLSDLIMANGILNINNTQLTSLNGLNNLRYVGGMFDIYNNPLLLNFNGLNNLEKVNNSFSIRNNASLINCNGLNNLKYISNGGDFSIENNNNLENLSGLDNLKGVSFSLHISYNSKLTSISALSNLEIINIEIYINDNPLLQSLNGLEKIKKVERLYIINNQALTNLNGLNNIESVGWVIKIDSNNNLTSLNGLEKVTTLALTGEITSYLEITGNSNLTSLIGLQNLSIMGGSNRNLKIINNTNLSGFCPLKTLLTNNQNFNSFNISNNLTNPNISYILTNCP